jgi:HK97 gp10 family phage protein
MISMKIDGLRQLDEELKKLPIELQKKELRSAVAKSSAILRNEIIAKAPVDTGRVKNNVYRFYAKKQSDSGKATYVVGIRNGKKRKYVNSGKNRRIGRAGKTYETEGEAFYWRFTEFGTKKMPARPFVRPAFDAKKTEIIESIKLSLTKSIKKIAQRHKKLRVK